MKIETVIIPKVKKTPKGDNVELMAYMFFLFAELVINTFLPFICGFYLALTGYLLWLIPLFILIIFNVRVEYTDKIEIRIVRGI
jgi:hypothetical protein